MTSTARLRSEAGFTLFEMLVSTGLIVLITGSVFSLLNPSYGTFQAQPEVSDMQQRLRVAADTVQKDLVMAGAGTYSGFMVGTLDNYFAPILPHRVGTISPDPAGSFRANPLCPTTCASAITIMYVPNTNSQTTIRTDMPTPSAELKVHQQPGCGEDDRDLCGFNDGDRVLIFDPTGAYDIFTITNTQDNALHLQHRDDKFTQKYYAGAWITRVESHTYYLNEVPATNTYQLRHYDGYQTDLPVADNVVDFRVEFFGDPLPPQIVRPVADLVGPWTTYGPKPPAIGIDNDKDTWGSGENCVFHVDGTSGLQVARPQIADAGHLARRSRAADGQHAHRRSVVPVGDQHGRRRHAEQVRRRPAARAPGARSPCACRWPTRSCGVRPACSSAMAAGRPAANATCRTRKSASTCRRAT